MEVKKCITMSGKRPIITEIAASAISGAVMSGGFLCCSTLAGLSEEDADSGPERVDSGKEGCEQAYDG
jgi:hypothetical protein